MSEHPLFLTVVSHTHWDREWYRPYQEFRLRLVRLIDDVLVILDADPTYPSFLLDGQTIILEDYLEMRPEREPDLRRLIATGRLLIGPWHILPDEFLVGPESTVRNLMLGARLCADFGARMPVGYTPDPFGHISQLPQILAGAGIDVAMFRRGLSEEPIELWWEAPDGTRVFAIYLREGYDNFQWAPTDPEAFMALVERQIARLGPHSRSGHLLLLNGTDHMPPQPELPALIRAANARLEGHAVIKHGTLPGYVASVRGALDSSDALPVVRGELRSPRRHHLLPGVLSARMWIKQDNHRCETLLTRYAEPLSAFNLALGRLDRRGELWRAWRVLLENHPHDSICGCSVDPVHEEMRTRFAWAEQIATGVIDEGLQRLGAQVGGAALPAPNSAPPAGALDFAITALPDNLGVIVFNPTPGARSETVNVEVPWLPPDQHPALYDDAGRALPCRWTDEREPLLEERTLDAAGFDALLSAIEVGAYRSRLIRDARLWLDGAEARAEIVLTESHPRDVNGLHALAQTVRIRLADQPVDRCILTTYFAVRRTLTFDAPDVLGVGYRVFRLSAEPGPAESTRPAESDGPWLENEHLRVEVDATDGTLALIDRRSGRRFAGLNRLEDGGDRGDEYNYCPPERDSLIDQPARAPRIERAGNCLQVHLSYRLPASLAADRAARSIDAIDLPVTVTVRLAPGARRVDIRTTLDNRAEDHRLRALFPTGIASGTAIVDGHFDRLRRAPLPDADTTGWVEQPQPTSAMRAFVAVADAEGGLMLAARGLPEYELIPAESGATLALTLLRCVGWLSREDFPCRAGQAGPELPTPGAQCPGPAAFEYSLIPFAAGDLDGAAAEAYAYEAPLRAALCVPGAGSLPAQSQLVTLEPPALVLTALKPAETGDGLIMRFYNSSERPQAGRVTFGFPVAGIEAVSLLEEPAGEMLPLIDERDVTVEVPPKRIVTWRVRPAR